MKLSSIAPLDDTTLEGAGALVAREHTIARAICPALPAEFSEVSTCTATLQRLRSAGYTGAVVVADGRTVAVMTLAVKSGTLYRRHAHMAPEGFAVEPDLADATLVVAQLFAELSETLVSRGVLQYFLDHVALPPLSEALANLGFGRHHVYACQRAVARTHLSNVEVRTGGVEDLESIARFAEIEIQHRATPPIFEPPFTPSIDDIRGMHQHLRDTGATHLIASIDGRDVGLLTIELTSPSPRLCADSQPYIGPTATHPDARGQGVGRALVDAALTWAEVHGYQSVSVDFEPANPLSRPFWLANGFKPIGYGVLRSIHSRHLC